MIHSIGHSYHRCLKDNDLERILAGAVLKSDVHHLDRCGRCRASLTASADALSRRIPNSAKTEFRLAAATVVPWQIQSKQTADGSLSCDIERVGDQTRLTVVADPAAWSDTVAIWPGASEPILIAVGVTQSISDDAYFSLDCWRVGKAELEFEFGHVTAGMKVSTNNTEVQTRLIHGELMLDWNSSTHSLLAGRSHSSWNELELPAAVSPVSAAKYRVFSALSSIDLLP